MVVYCWSGQGIAWSDLESLNKSGPQFELLCCWEKLRRKQEVGGKSSMSFKAERGSQRTELRNVCLMDLYRTWA